MKSAKPRSFWWHGSLRKNRKRRLREDLEEIPVPNHKHASHRRISP